MHKAALAVKKAMLECKKKYGIYYIIKMDVAKYFQKLMMAKQIIYIKMQKLEI